MSTNTLSVFSKCCAGALSGLTGLYEGSSYAELTEEDATIDVQSVVANSFGRHNKKTSSSNTRRVYKTQQEARRVIGVSFGLGCLNLPRCPNYSKYARFSIQTGTLVMFTYLYGYYRGGRL